jgi:hypothetical protein
MTARRNIGKDTILQWEDFAPSISSGLNINHSNVETDVEMLQSHPSKRRHA